MLGREMFVFINPIVHVFSISLDFPRPKPLDIALAGQVVGWIDKGDGSINTTKARKPPLALKKRQWWLSSLHFFAGKHPASAILVLNH